jgi:hypothetical protein
MFEAVRDLTPGPRMTVCNIGSKFFAMALGNLPSRCEGWFVAERAAWKEKGFSKGLGLFAVAPIEDIKVCLNSAYFSLVEFKFSDRQTQLNSSSSLPMSLTSLFLDLLAYTSSY